VYAIYEGKVFEAYQLYLNAGLYQQAHDLAVVELAPEAVIRQDLDLLVSLFERIASQTVDGWHTRGKVTLFLRSTHLFDTYNPTRSIWITLML
jgi:nuclear pore complex protein Nup98-Nup96